MDNIKDIIENLNHGITVRGNLVAECIMFHGKNMLQGDLIENPDYILKNDISLNYNYYIIKQIKNPLLQLFLHVDEDKAKKIFKNIQNLNKNKLAGQTNIMDFFKK